MRYFLGVDGGHSSTTVVIGDETGRLVGRGSGRPSNDEAALREGLLSACQSGGLDVHAIEFAAACLGFSGGPIEKGEIVRQTIRSHQLRIVDDAEIALAGAMGGDPGVITIAGTGSISFGRNAAGERARAGGWGYLFGDEGSALDIARQAVRAVMRSAEGWGPGTRLDDELLAATGAGTANEMLHRFYENGYARSKIAEFAIVVDRVANEGDPVAREILLQAAQQLALYTGAVRGQLFASGEPATVAYVGGVFRSALVRERFRMLVELEDGSRVIEPRRSPAEGALLEAYRLAGLTDVRI